MHTTPPAPDLATDIKEGLDRHFGLAHVHRRISYTHKGYGLCECGYEMGKEAPAPEWERAVEKAFSTHFKKDHHQNKLSVLKGIVSKALSSQTTQLMEVVKNLKSPQRGSGAFEGLNETDYGRGRDDTLEVFLSELKKLI